jgi:HlyD family secretion protein
MSLVSEIWSVLTPAQRRHVLAAQAISLAIALSTVTGIAAIAPFFAVLGNPGLVDDHRWLHWLYLLGGFPSKHVFVAALGIAFIAVVVTANFVNAVGSLAMNRLAVRIGQQLQTALFQEYLTRPYLFHTATSSSTLFNNVVYEVGRFNHGILQNAFMLVTSIATGSFILFSVLLLSPISVVMLVGLAAGYASIYLSMRARLLRLGQDNSRAWSERGRIVNESFGAIREILLLQDRRLFCEAFERTTGDVSETIAHIHAAGQLPKPIMECVAVSALVGAALVLSAQDERMGSWLGEITFIGFAAYRLLPILQQVFICTVNIRTDRSGFALIAPDLRRARESRNSSAPKDALLPDSWWDQRPRDEIRLKEVSFQYATEGPRVLDSVNLRIAAGATVGLVGANGSGKTTLMDLIAGLLLPTTGELQIDGVVLSAADRAAWHAQIAYVPQNLFLLDSSIAQNIAFGVPSAAVDRQRMMYAARLAQLEDFVATLPEGYNHKVGERGVQLSGGQRQKIGIARALYRQPAVLLLDEATSAIDGLTEAELMSTLGKLRGRYTIVLISHRISTVRFCDVIFQLENGKITGSGSYDELSRNSGRFERTVGA